MILKMNISSSILNLPNKIFSKYIVQIIFKRKFSVAALLFILSIVGCTDSIPTDSLRAASHGLRLDLPQRLFESSITNFDLEFRIDGSEQSVLDNQDGDKQVIINLIVGQEYRFTASWFSDSEFGGTFKVAEFDDTFVVPEENTSFNISVYDYNFDNDSDGVLNLTELENATNPADASSVRRTISADSVSRIFLRWFNVGDYDLSLMEPDGTVTDLVSLFDPSAGSPRWGLDEDNQGSSIDIGNDEFNSEIISPSVTPSQLLSGKHTVTVLHVSEDSQTSLPGFYVGCCGDGDEVDSGGFAIDSFAHNFIGTNDIGVGESFTFEFFIE